MEFIKDRYTIKIGKGDPQWRMLTQRQLQFNGYITIKHCRYCPSDNNFYALNDDNKYVKVTGGSVVLHEVIRERFSM